MRSCMRGAQRSLVAVIKRGRDGNPQVVVPGGFCPWRLGQRIWFQAVDGSVEITPVPAGRRRGRRHSRRLRRGLRSLIHDRPGRSRRL